jgi:hypothetical protein
MSTHDVERRETTGIVLGWIGLLLAGTLCGIGVFVVDTGILLVHSTGCEPGPADPDGVLVGRLSMAVVLIVMIGVWVLAWVGLSRHRTAVVVSALLAIVPALGYFTYGLDSGSWVGGFCIPF